MEIFGGLYVIKNRVLFDAITLAILSFNTVAKYSPTNFSILLITYAWTLQSTGLTSRWTLTFPMVPYFLLYIIKTQLLTNWGLIFSILLGLIVLFAGALCTLFPPVQVPPVKGKYKVGVVDFYLPVENAKKDFVSVRLLYPTDNITTKYSPYLPPSIGKMLCSIFMKLASPPEMRNFGFVLQYWTLIYVALQKHAVPLSSINGGKIPMAVFSHGLYGTADIYSHQVMSMAANGIVVLVVNHSDGSAPIMKLEDGSFVNFNTDYEKRFHGPELDHIRKWRISVGERSDEFLAATKAFIALNTKNIALLETLGISFVNKLNVNDMTFSGHSFGGGTCVYSAFRHPELVSRIVAFDPCCEWMPDRARHALYYDYSKGDAGSYVYDGGVGGYEKDISAEKLGDTAFCSKDLYFQFSAEWYRNNSANCKMLLEMSKNRTFGRPNGISKCEVLNKAHHQEFSDTCVLIPTWIGRPSGATGPDNPVENLIESAEKASKYIELSMSQED